MFFGAAALVGALLFSVGASAQTGIVVSDLNGLTLLQGDGFNVVAVAGDDGALMIDAGTPASAGALLDAVAEATGNDRVAMLINTHWHRNQTGANEAIGSAGGKIFAQEKTALFISNPVYELDTESWLDPLPEAGRPTETTRGEGSLEFAGITIEHGYLPAAHTDGDLFLFFPEQNVLVTGGVVAAGYWPLIDYRNGAWYGGRVRALQRLADLVNPETIVVPADGPLLSGSDIVRLRDIYLELFETMIGYMNMGFGPEDAAASNPLAQYTDEFGDASEFLYGAYRSMLIAYVPD